MPPIFAVRRNTVRRTGKQLDADANGTVDRKTAWVWDGQQVVMQLADADGAGAGTWKLTNRYLYGDAVDLVLADEQLPNGGISLTSVSYTTGNALWPLFDQLGSVRDVVDSNGVIRQHLVFDSFGNRLSETDYNTSGVVIPNNDPAAVDELFGYTGREWDSDVKLQYNRARWYDPAQGRWISQDPIGFSAGDVNLYRYVGNGTTGATDPSGLEEFDDQAFWDNVRFLDPEAYKWFHDHVGEVFRGDYWFNGSGTTYKAGHLVIPWVYLEVDYTEMAAAEEFVAVIRKKWIGGVASHFHASDDPDKMAVCRKEAHAAGAQAAVTMSSIYVSFVVPGPEDAVWGLAFSKYGIGLVQEGGEYIITRFGKKLAAGRADEAAAIVNQLAAKSGLSRLFGHNEYKVVDKALAGKVKSGLLDFFNKNGGAGIRYVDDAILDGRNGALNTVNGEIWISMGLRDKYPHLVEGTILEELQHFHQLKQCGWFGRELSNTEHDLLESEVVRRLLRSGLEIFE